jgi:hypothetical protein
MQRVQDWSLKEGARQEELERLKHYLEEEPEGIVKYAEAAGDSALDNQRFREKLKELLRTKTIEENQENRKWTNKWIKKIFSGIQKTIGSGRTKEQIDPMTRKTIVSDFQKWLSICRKLKRDLRSLRQDPAWTSEQFRKEAVSRLAKKYSLSEKEVTEIEDLPQDMTPWLMARRLVDRRHPKKGGLMRGEQKIEEIYRDWLKKHPEDRTRKPKPGLPKLCVKSLRQRCSWLMVFASV